MLIQERTQNESLGFLLYKLVTRTAAIAMASVGAGTIWGWPGFAMIFGALMFLDYRFTDLEVK